MVSLIQRSCVLKRWYQECQEKVRRPEITDLSLAMHRFDSQARPLSVLCLTLSAVNMVAVRLYQARKGESGGQAAQEHLEFVSGEEGAERLIQAGMLADAADEGLLFARFHDQEGADTAQLLSERSRLVARMKVLFLDRVLWMGGRQR